MFDWDGSDFTGTKIALIHDSKLVTFQRDNVSHIPFPGKWDFAGGGREGQETPDECAIRETSEELNLYLFEDRIVWRKLYPNWQGDGRVSFFMAAHLSANEVAAIRLGNEGQRWQLMAISEYMSHPDAINHLQDRLYDYLNR